MIARIGAIGLYLCAVVVVIVVAMAIVTFLDEWLHPWHKRGKG